jgi:GNAT superfamily N-acetyltransferase
VGVDRTLEIFDTTGSRLARRLFIEEGR